MKYLPEIITLMTEIQLEIAKDKIELPVALCCAFDKPYTIPNDAPNIIIVTV